jgi:cobyric acid synthase CobQ
VGTLETMAEWERDLVAGFVVNRFRGKEELLADAHEHVLSHVGKPVLGVVPFLTNLGLPEEDSVSFKDRRSGDGATDELDIALIDLPHISNFTDFDAFGVEPDARVRVVRKASELGVPDAVILPGSKSVVSDLTFLRASGIADAVLALVGKSEIIGICGGYQMLGRRIEDPAAVETAGGGADGMGLLPVTTVMAADKTLKRVSTRHEPSGEALEGYEIHHGLTSPLEDLEALVTSSDGTVIAFGRGLVWGCYLHGMFDADGFRRWFIDRLRVRRGWKPIGRVVAVYETEIAFDRLAAVVRERLDMRRIYQLMGL